MQLKKNLRQILAEREMTISLLSRKTQVPKSTISEWMAGASPRDLKKLKIIAECLGYTVDELCFGNQASRTRSAADCSIEPHLEEIKAGVYEVILRKIRNP